jgi:hypothetical protein
MNLSNLVVGNKIMVDELECVIVVIDNNKKSITCL